MLSTPRLRLRPYRRDEADLAFFRSWTADPEVVRHSSTGVLDAARAEALFLKGFSIVSEGRFSVWCVEEGGRPVGHAELKPRAGEEGLELVYFLVPAAQGRGLGTELVGALTQRALALAGRALATVDPENARSLRVLERLGWKELRREKDADGQVTVWLEKKA